MAEAALETKLEEEEGDVTGTDPWFADRKYDRYWSHYNEIKSWMNSQHSVLGNRASVPQESAASSWLQVYHQYYQNYQYWMHCNQQYLHSNPPHHTCNVHSSWYNQETSQSKCHHHPGHQQYQENKQPHSHHLNQPHPSLGGYRGNNRYATDQSDVDYLDNGLDDEEQEENGGAWVDHSHDGKQEEFEVELSEEMRAFFLQSQKHREELKEARLELSKKRSREEGGDGMEETVAGQQTESVLDYEDEFEAKCPSSKKSKKKLIVGAPTEQPGKRRAEEMKLLYGKDSPAIHGMETAIQMQFDRNCDKKQPSHWPTVPLKM